MSRTHNLTPKIFCLFNMAFNNAMKVYLALVAIHTPDKKIKSIPKCISKLAHYYMQCGPTMRQYNAVQPKPACSDALARLVLMQKR